MGLGIYRKCDKYQVGLGTKCSITSHARRVQKFVRVHSAAHVLNGEYYLKIEFGAHVYSEKTILIMIVGN